MSEAIIYKGIVAADIRALYEAFPREVDLTAPCFVILPSKLTGIWKATLEAFGHQPLPVPYKRFYVSSNTTPVFVEIGETHITARSVLRIREGSVGGRDENVPMTVKMPVDTPLCEYDDFNRALFNREHMSWFPVTTAMIHLYYLRRLSLRSAIAKVTTEATHGEAEKRLRKGKKLPYFGYSLVRPNEYRLRDSVRSLRPHGSPRLHQRMAHARILRSGRTVQVRNCVVGKADKGVVLQDYLV